jgi:hypothetical protein
MSVVTWEAFQSLTMPDLPGCPWLSVKDALRHSASEFCERSKVWRTEGPSILTTENMVSDYTPALGGLIERIWHIYLPGSVTPLRSVNTARIPGGIMILQGGAVTQLPSGQLVDSSGSPLVDSNGEPLYATDSGSFSLIQNASGQLVDSNGDPLFDINGEALYSNDSGSGGSSTLSSITGTPVAYAQVNDFTIRLFPAPDKGYALKLVAALKPDRLNSTGVENFIFQTYAEVIASGAIYRLAVKPLKKEWSNPELAAYHKAVFETGIDKALYKDMQGVMPRSRPRFV